MIAFWPVPSRRLGRSLGINNILPKNCTYACVHCQLGRTTRMRVERRPAYEPEEILNAVWDRVAKTRTAGVSMKMQRVHWSRKKNGKTRRRCGGVQEDSAGHGWFP
jgi:wyosine [tRNA(Phe)-imidazoG37] synthetase (radical SAM superfamily)